jgi:Family of unknown function (DUF6644)
MWFVDLLKWLHDTGFSVMLRESTWAEPAIESIHVLTLTLFLGFAVLLDLRLLGLCLRRRPASQILHQLNPVLGGAFVVMILSGTLLFCSDPVAFYTTIFLKIKMILLVLAGLNVLIFNATVGRRVAGWDLELRTPRGARVAAVVSLVLWVAIVAAGRAIAYALPPP